MALDFVKNQISCFQFTSVVVDIFDRYMTFKNLSKGRTGPSIQVCFPCIWLKVGLFLTGKKFISSGETIIRFLGDYIAKHIRQNSSLQEEQSLYLTGLFSNPETVKMLNQNGMLDCSCLASTQEEADTRIILNALYSDKLYPDEYVWQCNRREI
jgi:hypothetical protein